jgi:predicted permease
MSWLEKLFINVRMLFHRGREQQRLEEELGFHLDRQIADNLAAGMSAAEARSAAVQAFGNMLTIRDQTHNTWNWTWLERLLQDIRFALRQLTSAPGFTLVAVLTLALGIGATTALFTLVYQVVLRSIPVSRPNELYKVGKENSCCVEGGLQHDWSMFSFDLYRYFGDHTPGIDGIAAVQAGDITLSAHRTGDNAGAFPLVASLVSGNYFSFLGVKPLVGRVFSPDDDHEGAAPVAVISYTLWQTKFGGDRHLVGSTVILSGHPVTLIGITAREFHGERNTQSPADLWIPLSQEPTLEPDRQLLKVPGIHYLDLLVRISDPRRVAEVQAALQGELRQWLTANPGVTQNGTPQDIAGQTTELASASGGINELRDQYQRSLTLLFLVTGFVLLIVCANLANLMLVRGMARQRELSVRSALGAPRIRLVRQVLIESILLAVFGGTAALVVACLGTHAIIALAIPGAEVTTLSAAPSLPVLVFALLLSLLTGVLFGLAPALITSRANPVEALRGANRSTGDASALPQKLLVILQAALSLALISTAGLLISSLRHLEHQDFRFEPQGRLLLTIDLQAAGYKYVQLAPFYQKLDHAFAHFPGVDSFAYASYGPMTGDRWGIGIDFPGVASNGKSVAFYDSVSADFFEAIGTKILLGRGIDESDTATSRHVVVVNQAFVHKFLKNKYPIGEHFGPEGDMASEYEIVGVVEDTKYGDPGSSAGVPMFFMPITQKTIYTTADGISQENVMHFASSFIFRYRGDKGDMMASVRRTLKSIDPDIPVLDLRPYGDQVRSSFTQEELVVRLTTLFGVLALILAALGLYGVTAYAVARRTSEIGIRMALGAGRASVLQMIVSGAMATTVIGLAIGLPMAYAGARFVQSSLYQTSAFQPLVLLAAIVLLLLAAVTAALVPARRAASINPTEALRTE